jgi:death-on-curing protein
VPKNASSRPNFLTYEKVVQIHQDQIEAFGGSSGIRDEGLLYSALAQPQATFGQEMLHPSIPEQAAAYLYHLVMNHPFVDGNKRTAFAVTDVFLRLNGYRLTLTDSLAYVLVIQVAEGQVDKAGILKILQAGLETV